MNKAAARRKTALERKVKRLEREIEEIAEYFYHLDRTSDREQYASMLERRRDDAVRSVVLQLFTGIEDLLTLLIAQQLIGKGANERLKPRSFYGGRLMSCFFLNSASCIFSRS